jgi:hypothetical protein
MSFQVFVLQLRLRSKHPYFFRSHGAANLVRGQFGRELFENFPDLYERLLAPASAAPSGLKDPPRPYVLRSRELDYRNFAVGEELPFRVHLFEPGWPGCERVELDLCPRAEAVSRVKVEFLTPTELKGAEGLEFGALFARLRDRISILRALYGVGPLEIDFRGMGERAQAIRTVRMDVQAVQRIRVSRSNGQHHSIGGVTGEAEYEGDLAEFLPYLEAGFWTGVGRHTVWGNGEIRTTRLR